MEKRIVFNHFYKLRHDITRTHILAPAYIEKDEHEYMVKRRWMSRIHPVYAMIFSFLSEPIFLSDLLKELSYFMDLPENEVDKIVRPLINNQNTEVSQYCGTNHYFPPNIIIDEDKQFCETVHYTPQQFAYKILDLKQERYNIAPASISLMINNRCYTDCVYCYANKKVMPVQLNFERVKEIILQAKKLGVAIITVVGGEVFLYKKWRDLFDFMIENGYRESLVSTKVPLTEQDIADFKRYDIPMQISLDSVNSETLQKILYVKPDYSEKIKQTIANVDKYEIYFQVNTVLTTLNDSLENLQAVHDFLCRFKNLRRWEIRISFKSMYSKADFDSIKTSKEQINRIDEWVREIKKSTSIKNILWEKNSIDRYFQTTKGSKFFAGNRCSANFSNIFVLPDGKVTICEQLYWKPQFIIGDLTTQSVEEVWNSPRALELAFPQREKFSDASVCKKCTIFAECYAIHNKCYVDVVKGYGDENWDFPDPRCKFAPKFIYNLNPD